MDTHLSLSSLLITLSFFSTVTPPSHCIEYDLFLACSRPYECGNLKNISFPFWGGERPQYCGQYREYKLECRNDSYAVMQFEELEFRVLNINQSTRSMSIARVDLWDIQQYCPRKFVNTALNYTLFDYNHQTVQNLTLVYNCSSQVNTSEEKRFMCGPEGGDRYHYTYYLDEINNTEVAKCRSNIKVPILRRGAAALSGQDPQERGNQTLQIVLNEGFEVKYLNDMTFVCSECEKSGGSCGSNMSYSTAPFVCFCRGEVNSVIICRRDAQGEDTLRLVLILTPTATIVLLLGLVMCYLKRRKLKLKGSKSKMNHTAAAEHFNGNVPNLQVFTLDEIEAATGKLSIENKVGEGGYGPVYKGKLPNGQEIAVKKLSKTSTQGFEEFKNEVVLTAKLQHVNLVRLLGFCTERNEQMLIYEYMANKSLDFYLFDPSKSYILDWRRRIIIIEGITQGLLYLQEYSRMTIIHRDIKASNILLDEEMKPKISDFGMARTFMKHEHEANTGRIVGTYGYVPPEYVKRGVYSTKSDVYSFGVLLLQIISGKRNAYYYGSDGSLNLLEYAYELLKEDKGMEFMDPSLDDTLLSWKLNRCMQIALLCVQETAKDRPSMLEVSSMLKNESAALTIPKKPAFSRKTDEDQEEDRPILKQEICSDNIATISELVAR